MDAPAASFGLPASLALPEAFVLLTLDRQIFPEMVMAASLIELELQRRIRVSPVKKRKLVLEPISAPPGNDPLYQLWRLIEAHEKREWTMDGITREARKSMNLLQAAWDRMIAAGLLTATGKKALFSRRMKYRSADPENVNAVKHAVFRALIERDQLSERDHALVALLAARGGAFGNVRDAVRSLQSADQSDSARRERNEQAKIATSYAVEIMEQNPIANLAFDLGKTRRERVEGWAEP